MARNKVKKQIVKDTLAPLGPAIILVAGMSMSLFFTGSRRRVEHSPMATPAVVDAAFSGTESCSSSGVIVTTDASADELRTGSSMGTAIPTLRSAEILPESSATVAGDDCLGFVDDLPSARRSNPTTAILAKVDSANALKYEGSMLYKNEEGQWVAEPMPEGIAERVAPSTTKIMGDRVVSPTMV